MRQGWNLDDDLYLPVTTLQDRFIGNNHIDYFSIKAVTPEKVQQASKEVMEIITKHHNGQEEYYGTSITADFATGPLDKIRVVLQISLTSIAFISLVVGGIGIMNMVLVSVNERTREIGLRKALGAKKRDIFFQFLAESTLMSSVGGAIGIILGFFYGLWYFNRPIPFHHSCRRVANGLSHKMGSDFYSFFSLYWYRFWSVSRH